MSLSIYIKGDYIPKYICVRDSVNPMPYEDLAELVAGGYVNVA